MPRPTIFDEFDATNEPEKYSDAAKEQEEKYGVIGSYNWNNKYYGCKWDCSFDTTQYCESDSKAFISIYFDSPWTSPISWFENMQAKYPHLDFNVEYLESGNCFAGRGETVRGDGYVYFDTTDYADWKDSPLYDEWLGEDEYLDLENEYLNSEDED